MSNSNSWLSEDDKHLFGEGTHYRGYDKLGAHFSSHEGRRGAHFAVWAPHARRVSVVGDFNNWDELTNPLVCQSGCGIWEGFVPGAGIGQTYKYSIHSNVNDYHVLKADPYAFYAEVPPRSGSVVWDINDYHWADQYWMQERGERQKHNRPMTIYEVHLGSWRRKPEEGGAYLGYRDLAEQLPAYVKEMGFTHVEFLPVMEHPHEVSCGYQSLGYFAPTSRFGTPQEFMHLVDRLHQAGIGVIGDWVPRHFPSDRHGLSFFDGTCLYEYADSRKGYRKEWGTLVFDFGRKEVVSYLISSALFWLDKYHLDGLRLDAIASLLYLDYSREEGDWVPNADGGREHLEGIAFLRRLNEVVYERHPDVFTVAEESTVWPMVSRPTYAGGLGFGNKWNIGWVNDVLDYLAKDPVHRPYHHNNLTFGLVYAFQENFILPLSHSESGGGKGSLLRRMSGDDWQKFANLRLLLAYMYGTPGKKLLFMGNEFAQWDEWNPNRSLDWHLLQYGPHCGMQQWVRDLNQVVRSEPALHQNDFSQEGFCWIDCNDHSNSVVSFLRHGYNWQDTVACVFNFTPVVRSNCRIGVPHGGYWEELLNSDAGVYGGSGVGNLGGICSESIPAFGQPNSFVPTLPPLGALFFRLSRG